MAEMKQGLNSEEDKSLGRNGSGKKTSGVRIPPVDFEDLNFEQRRAPYNSGSRFITDGEHDQSRCDDDSAYKH